MNIAMRICNIAFDAFFDDTKKLVSDGVKKDVKQRINAASSQEDRTAAISRGKIRISALRSWKKFNRPLAYGLSDGAKEGYEIFQHLLRAVSENDATLSRGFRGWNDNSKTHHDFARLLIDMSHPTSPIAPVAPVLRDGSFLPVLKVAHTSILQIAHMDGLVSEQIFLNSAIRTALVVFKIHFFPAHRDNTPTRGAPYRVPLFNYWGNLGLRSSENDPPIDPDVISVRPPSVEPETIAYNNAVASDCRAPWKAATLNLKTLKKELNKTILPKDFTVPEKIKEMYVDDTYDFVLEKYDGTKKIHHLALLVGIIVASSLLPSLFPPDNSRPDFKKARTKQEVRAIYEDMDWCVRAKKGMKDKKIFIGMITSYIIALYERKSPLREHMVTGGLGNAWTYKNSRPTIQSRLPSPTFVELNPCASSCEGHHLCPSHSPQHSLGHRCRWIR
jgi:hypothetical protein